MDMFYSLKVQKGFINLLVSYLNKVSTCAITTMKNIEHRGAVVRNLCFIFRKLS